MQDLGELGIILAEETGNEENMRSMKRLIKNVRRLWRAMVLVAGGMVVLTACSNDEGNKPIPVYGPQQLSFAEQFTTTTENGLTITRDESGRVTNIRAFEPGLDDVEKLMSAPASLEDIRYLFALSESNEIRLTGEGQNPAWEELPDYPQFYEAYTQYYKDVRVSGTLRVNYFGTPAGKRMSYAMGLPFIDVKDLDVMPNVTERQARQVLADYLDEARDDNWPCELNIKEYSTRRDGKIHRDVRLIYSITGPLVPNEPGVWFCTIPHYMAEVDAHSGELLYVSDFSYWPWTGLGLQLTHRL